MNGDEFTIRPADEQIPLELLGENLPQLEYDLLNVWPRIADLLHVKTAEVPLRISPVATKGEISGWNLDVNFIESKTGTLRLDSANEYIRIGMAAGNHIFIDGLNTRIRSSNYVSGPMGAGFSLDPNLLEVGNIACRGLIRTAVFQKDIISAHAGNLAILPNSDVLDADMSATDNSTLTIKGTATFAVGDILRIKDGTDDEWMEVTAIGSAPTYTVTRDKASVYGANANPAWKKGASVVNYGQSGDGGVYLTASDTNAPYLSVFTHAGSPWSALTTKLRLGNLNGYAGYSSDEYGLAFYKDASNYLKLDLTNGIQISVSSANAITIKSGGDIKIESGGDLDLYSAEGDSAAITFHAQHFNMMIRLVYGSDDLDIIPLTADQCQLNLGVTSYRWYRIDLRSSGVVTLVADFGGTYPTSIALGTLYYGDVVLSTISDASVRPETDNYTNLGEDSYAWKDLYYYVAHDKCLYLDAIDDLAILEAMTPLSKDGQIVLDSNGLPRLDLLSLPDWMTNIDSLLVAVNAEIAPMPPITMEELKRLIMDGSFATKDDPQSRLFRRPGHLLDVAAGALRNLAARLKDLEAQVQTLIAKVGG